ncbi:hypothetical protein ACI6QG_07760 [Roseococcus sp. DSY-14]|uniref:hypothetical protein n=1 Tax=Roseococcus sp. DSY-14 TaxID=3369650 RepID=UPI00387AA80D
MILRPMGATMGMLSLALVAKWAFLAGMAAGSVAIGALCALRGRRTAAPTMDEPPPA